MNVIWFVVDTLRADHLGCYGYFRQTSPNLDQLAREGVLFEDSYASAIATGPGFTSLFTGRAAINHGFYLTPWNVANAPLLDDRVVTLPELIQARGDYTTAAFDNLINFRSHMKHFVRGFEFYTNVTRSPAWLHHHIRADEVNHRLLPWLERHADEPFFVFVHYWDPHTPYNMPDDFRGRFDQASDDLVTERAADGYDYVPGWGRADALPGGGEPESVDPYDVVERSIDLYDDEVFYTDHSIGRVREKLEELGVLDETALIVTSDHGEDLGLHGLWGHGTVHNTTIRVPLIIRDPQHLPAGERIEGFVQHADDLPTILEYFPQQSRPDFGRVNVEEAMPEMSSQFDGASLLALARGERDAPEEIIVESATQRAYISPPWKLIWYKGDRASELFHLRNDPLELNDRAGEARGVRDELSEKLEAWVARNLAGERTDPLFATGGAWTCYIEEEE
ncbi:MAG: sulfatase [Chloroflexota bacterium]|nr:sulfatase [Chloroflexota bacterium]